MSFPFRRATFEPMTFVAGLLASTSLFAQESPSNPADASVPTSPLIYQSAFTGYLPWKDAPLADWRTANAAVSESGESSEHSGHGMASGEKAAPADPHAGHDMQHGAMK